MHSFVYLTLGAFAALAAAQSDSNAFNVPKDGWNFRGGESTTVTWNPSTEGTVTLKLQKGTNTTPDSGIVIAGNIDNEGSYEFTPPSNLGPGSDYNIQILDDDDPTNYNFSPSFSVAGTTGTGSELPTQIETNTPSGTATDSTATATDSDSTATGTTTSGMTTTSGVTETTETTMTSMTSMTTTDMSSTTSAPSTSSDESSTTTSSGETSSEEPTESPTSAPDPDEDGAMGMGVPAGLLTGMLAFAALL